MASIACDELFSEIPHDISQKILSCLTLKQRAISSLVSKNWYHMITWLDDDKFVQIHRINRYCHWTNVPFRINCYSHQTCCRQHYFTRIIFVYTKLFCFPHAFLCDFRVKIINRSALKRLRCYWLGKLSPHARYVLILLVYLPQLWPILLVSALWLLS